MSDDIKHKAISGELAAAIDSETSAAYAQGAEAVWNMLGCGMDPRFPNVAIAITRDLPDDGSGAFLPQYEIVPKANLAAANSLPEGAPSPQPMRPVG